MGFFKSIENLAGSNKEQVEANRFLCKDDIGLIRVELEKEGLEGDILAFIEKSPEMLTELRAINQMSSRMDRLGKNLAKIEKSKIISGYIARFKTLKVVKPTG